jgi:hypothetical protein
MFIRKINKIRVKIPPHMKMSVIFVALITTDKPIIEELHKNI